MTGQIPQPTPSKEQRDTNAMWRRNFVLMAVFAAVLAVTFIVSLAANRSSDAAERKIATCRSNLAIDQDAALADVMVGIGVAVDEVDPSELDRPLSEALPALDDAEEARRSYNDNTDQPCPRP